MNQSKFPVFRTHQSSEWRVQAAVWCVAKLGFAFCSGIRRDPLPRHTDGHLTADAPVWINLRMCLDAYAMMLNNSMCTHLA